jgi:cytochrome c biogenesis protein CcdA
MRVMRNFLGSEGREWLAWYGGTLVVLFLGAFGLRCAEDEAEKKTEQAKYRQEQARHSDRHCMETLRIIRDHETGYCFAACGYGHHFALTWVPCRVREDPH